MFVNPMKIDRMSVFMSFSTVFLNSPVTVKRSTFKQVIGSVLVLDYGFREIYRSQQELQSSFKECVFTEIEGCALYCASAFTIAIDNCLFSNNHYSASGYACTYFTAANSVKITRCCYSHCDYDYSAYGINSHSAKIPQCHVNQTAEYASGWTHATHGSWSGAQGDFRNTFNNATLCKATKCRAGFCFTPHNASAYIRFDTATNNSAVSTLSLCTPGYSFLSHFNLIMNKASHGLVEYAHGPSKAEMNGFVLVGNEGMEEGRHVHF